MTTYHKSLNRRHLFSLSSGDWKSKIRMLAWVGFWWRPSWQAVDQLLMCPHMAFPGCLCTWEGSSGALPVLVRALTASKGFLSKASLPYSLNHVHLCDLMDYSPRGSSVHGILQARILKLVALLFSRGSSWPSDWTQVSRIAGSFFNVQALLYFLPKSHLPIPPHWGLGCQHMNFGRTQTFSPL